MNSVGGKSFKRGVEGSYTHIIAQRRFMACDPETFPRGKGCINEESPNKSNPPFVFSNHSFRIFEGKVFSKMRC